MNQKRKVRKKRREEVDTRTLVKYLLLPLVAAGVFVLLLFSIPMIVDSFQKDPDITVYKQPNCFSGSSWVDVLRRHEFTVKVKKMNYLGAIRRKNGVPKQFSSCYTAYSNGFFIEGYVPPSHIRKLILGGRSIRGVALAGFQYKKDWNNQKSRSYGDVIIFDHNGNISLFEEFSKSTQ